MAVIQNGTRKSVAAIIAEYNPFHNGHKYHIEQTRLKGADFVIAIMSGNTVQRGETAIFDKHFRAKSAVNNGCDLVIELPYPYSSASARDFAFGAVSIIKRLGVVDTLSFGCEDDDASLLKDTANACFELTDSEIVSSYMKSGMSYPSAIHKAICEQYGHRLGDCLSSPNNTLAIEYISALDRLSCDIGILPVKRSGSGHDTDEISGNIASASHIRSLIRNGEDSSAFLPYDISDVVFGDVDRISDMILLSLISDIKALDRLPEELSVRVRNVLTQGSAKTFNELVDAVKSKNFTRARISRELLYAFIHSMSGIQPTDALPYARVLAFNDNGRLLLKEIEKRSEDITVSSSLSELEKYSYELSALDNFTSRIQSLSAGKSISNEFTGKFDGYIKD